MSPDELRLNSLDRFTKQSPRFLLEEHSHCEVPAGCGGVVLRWVNPAAGLPVTLDVFHRAPATLAVDDTVVTTTHLLLSPGRHVLSLQFADTPGDGGALFALVGRRRLARAEGIPDDTVVLRSVADRSWLCLATAPAAGWTTDPGFDDRDWLPMVEGHVEEPAERTERAWAFRRAVPYGHAGPLGAPSGLAGGPLRVRKVFTVPEIGAS